MSHHICKEHHSKCLCPAGVNLLTLNVIQVQVPTFSRFAGGVPLGPMINLMVTHSPIIQGNPDILILCGFPHAWTSFKNFLGNASFTSKFNVYVMDTRGFGQSDKPPSFPGPGPGDEVYNINTIARDINAVITTLGMPNPIILGHSAGAAFFLDYARVFGHDGINPGIGGFGAVPAVGTQIKAYISLDGTPGGQKNYSTPETLALAPALFTEDLHITFPSTQAFIKLSTFCTLNEADFTDYCQGDTTSSLSGRVGVLLGEKPPNNFDVLVSLGLLPALIIWGLKDRVLLPTAPDDFQTYLQNAKRVNLKCTGHSPMQEKPLKTMKIITKFLI